MSNNEIYKNIFIKLFSISEEDLKNDFTFKDNDIWDSLAHLELISELEENFDVLFDSEDILNYQSFLNGKKILTKYGVLFD